MKTIAKRGKSTYLAQRVNKIVGDSIHISLYIRGYYMNDICARVEHFLWRQTIQSDVMAKCD